MGNYDRMYYVYELSGANPAGVTQDLCGLLIAPLVVIGLGLIRFFSLKLTACQPKEEMPMNKSKLILLTSATSETMWAMLVNYTVGTCWSPIGHKLPMLKCGFHVE